MRAAILCLLSLSVLVQAQTPVLSVEPAEIAALQKQGYRFHAGRWRLPAEIAYLQRAEAKRTAPPAAAAAIASAKAPAAKGAVKAARPVARGTPRQPNTVGTMQLRVQHASLLGLDTVPVSFGTGQARLQLPRTQIISIGTTVALPLR